MGNSTAIKKIQDAGELATASEEGIVDGKNIKNK